jgi:hypothetical protein
MASSPPANPRAIGIVPARAICERDCGTEYLKQEFGPELSPGHGTNSVPILRNEDNLQRVAD